MTSARADVSKQMMTSAKSLARGSAWRRVTDTGGAWRRVEARADDAEISGGAWRRVEGPMKTKFYRTTDWRDYFPMMLSVV